MQRQKKPQSESMGARGEDFACAMLKEMGMNILMRNYRSRWGEIDIVASDASSLCFVEVKARRAGAMVDGAAAVTPAKQKKLIKTAMCWLMEFPCDLQPRFDVLALTALPTGGFSHQYYAAAFDGGSYDNG